MMDRQTQSIVRAACTAVVSLALCGCATLNREGVVAPVDSGSVAVRQGAPLVINLTAPSEAGFGWVLTSKPDAGVYLIGGPDYTPDPMPPGMMGVGGTTTFRFRAKATGTQTLEFAYRPMLEKDAPPAKTARYDVTVKSAGWENWF